MAIGGQSDLIAIQAGGDGRESLPVKLGLVRSHRVPASCQRGRVGQRSDFRLGEAAIGSSSGRMPCRGSTVIDSPVAGVAPEPRSLSRNGRLPEFVALALVAIGVPLAWWIASTLLIRGNGFNDFHDFYLAAQLITQGHSPYDKAALAALARSEGLSFVVGTGYSYPLPFALAMIPFVALPFTAAVLVFNGLSLVLFGVTVAAWIGWAHGSDPGLRRRRLALAGAAAAYPSVYGTIANGQAGLLLLPLLGLGTIGILEAKNAHRFLGGVSVGLAAIVKLTPGLFVVPMLLGREFRAAIGLVVESELGKGSTFYFKI